MPTLTIKGLPDNIYRLLKRRAARHRRSLNSEIIVCLEQAAALPSVDPETWLIETDRLREHLRLTPLNESSLRKAKAAGRA